MGTRRRKIRNVQREMQVQKIMKVMVGVFKRFSLLTKNNERGGKKKLTKELSVRGQEENM